MQNTSYVLVPYEEYQELLALKEKSQIEEKEKILFERIEGKLCLSLRTSNALKEGKTYYYDYIPATTENRHGTYIKKFRDLRSKFIYLGDLVTLQESEVMKICNLGRKSLFELKSELRNFGLHFGMELPKSIIEKLETLKTTSNK